MNIKKIAPSLLLFVFFTEFCYAVPNWASEFRSLSLEYKTLSGDSRFQEHQTDLGILEKTGRANCVGWSKLMAKIALKHEVEFSECIYAENTKEDRDKQSHQVTVLKEKNGHLWLQSNFALIRIADINDVARIVAYEMDWENGSHLVIQFNVTKEDLY